MTGNFEVLPESRMLVVCAWCFPRESIYKAHPDLKTLGYSLSHGICQQCFAGMTRGADNKANRRNEHEPSHLEA